MTEREPDPAIATAIVPDTEHGRGLDALPARARDLIQLARFDRPIGAWLLFWPGAWAVALAGAGGGWRAAAGATATRWWLIAWLALGAVAMRGAGCVYNDIVDRRLDAQVARTRARPLASGRVSPAIAWAFMLFLCLVGLIILLHFNPAAQRIALGSLLPVAIYPFVKRVSWWPQAWLGIVFAWAAPVGWAAVTGRLDGAGLYLYAAAVAWVIGYDTIYALQDLEDDALAGVKSSARALGRHARTGIGLFYLLAVLLAGCALWRVRPDPRALLALLPWAVHLGWQVAALRPADPVDALARFRSNRFAGLLMFLACAVVGSAGA